MFTKVNEYLSGYGGNIGVLIESLHGQETYSINPHMEFKAASLIKNAIMWTYYKKVAQGELHDQDIHVLQPSEKIGVTPYDTGIIRDLHDGIGLTLEDLVTMMIAVSDDTATNILIDILGEESIKSEISAIGMENTKLQRRMMEYDKAARGIDNITSAYDMSVLLKRILYANEMPKHLCEKMLEILSKQRFTAGLPSLLPQNVRIAHKTGTISQFGLEHDVGVICDKNGEPAIIICVLTMGIANSLNVIGNIAKLAYDAILNK